MKNRISLSKSVAVKKPAPMEKSRGLWGLLGKFPSGLAEIILLFLVSRGVLTMVGVLSVSLIARRKGGRLEWDHPSQSWLDIWGQWDTGWYLDIAKVGNKSNSSGKGIAKELNQGSARCRDEKIIDHFRNEQS